jgi:hypothetical protein
MTSQSDILNLRFLNRKLLNPGESRDIDEEQRIEDERGEQAGDIEREDKAELDPRFTVTEKFMEDLLLKPYVNR